MMELMLLFIFMVSFCLETYILSNKEDLTFERYIRKLDSVEKLKIKQKEFEQFRNKIEQIEMKIDKEEEEELYDYNKLMEKARKNIQQRNIKAREYYINKNIDLNLDYDNFRDSLSKYNSGEIQIAFY